MDFRGSVHRVSIPCIFISVSTRCKFSYKFIPAQFLEPTLAHGHSPPSFVGNPLLRYRAAERIQTTGRKLEQGGKEDSFPEIARIEGEPCP